MYDAADARPDLVTVEAIACLRLCAKRRHLELRVVHASNELRALLELVGLDDVVVVEG